MQDHPSLLLEFAVLGACASMGVVGADDLLNATGADRGQLSDVLEKLESEGLLRVGSLGGAGIEGIIVSAPGVVLSRRGGNA
ncbi:MAG: hypothetical protein AAB420_02575 [Patescibacteria group bacterium]